MRILFVSDTWSEDGKVVNGVITWLKNMKATLEKAGHHVTIIHPKLFIHMPFPLYPDLPIAFFMRKKMKGIIEKGSFDIIHIATEGSAGWAAKRICDRKGLAYSTYYHTQLPEYTHVYTHSRILEHHAVSYVRWFHKKSVAICVNTKTMHDQLVSRGFKNIFITPPGVNPMFFEKFPESSSELKKPVFVFMGRLAREKNIDAFLDCDLPGTKLVIGEGPDKERLEEKYPDTVFTGKKIGEELVRELRKGDVFVFPSKTDTFGFAIIEALAAGLPVAAYETYGTKDIITNGVDGYVGEFLSENALQCLHLKKEDCINTAKKYSWKTAMETFLALNKKSN